MWLKACSGCNERASFVFHKHPVFIGEIFPLEALKSMLALMNQTSGISKFSQKWLKRGCMFYLWCPINCHGMTMLQLHSLLEYNVCSPDLPLQVILVDKLISIVTGVYFSMQRYLLLQSLFDLHKVSLKAFGKKTKCGGVEHQSTQMKFHIIWYYSTY